MPTQRIIKSKFIGADNKPLRNAPIQVIHMLGNTFDNIEFPQDSKKFITNSNGEVSFTLWCNEEGERASFYRFLLPGGDTFDAVVPIGTSDLELSVLRDGGGNSSAPQYQSLISYILSEVGTGVTIASSTIAGVVKTNSNSTDPVVYLKSEVDSLIAVATGADLSNYYTKPQTDTLLNTKANTSEVNTSLSVKANSADVYSKTQTDSLINARPDALNELVDTTISSPANGQALIYNNSTSKWENQTISTGGSGEVNTASNVGIGGIGFYKQKTGSNLEFRNINAGSTKISITNDSANNEIDVDVNEANLTLGNLSGTLAIAKGGTGSTSSSAALTALGAASSTSLTSHTENTSNPHNTTAIQVGAIPTTDKGIASGVATLDATGKIPDNQIPDTITRDSELTAGLATKANQSTTYTKTEVDTLVATKDTLIELTDVVVSAPSNNQVIAYNSTTSKWTNQTISAGGTGETNTASNVGVGGIGIYKQKTGANLEFKNINAASTKVAITNDAANNEVDIDVVESNLTLSNIGGTLPITKGGTGAITASAALTALGGATSANLTSHTGNTSNPHSTTAAQVGAIATTARGAANGVASLDSSSKIPDAQIPDGITRDTELTAGLSTKADSSALTSHTGNINNPHSTTAAQVGNSTAQWNANKIQGIDVISTAPTNGQILTYNSTNSRWEPTTSSGGGGGSTTLATLTDVNISSPNNNQVLTYNTATSKWTNQTPSSGSGIDPWVLKTSNYTAVAGDRLLIDTSSSPWVLTLPASPTVDQEIDLLGVNNLSINNLSINLNGSKINAQTPFFVRLRKNYYSIKLVYINSTIGWVTTDPTTLILSNAYNTEVLSDNPWSYLRLGETSGTTAVDSSPNSRNGTYNGGFTLGQASSLSYDTNTSALFNGSNTHISFAQSSTNPQRFTLECRFKTTQTNGGLIGFSDVQGASGATNYDREIRLIDGKLQFYIYSGATVIISSTANYNDNNWHTVSAVIANIGMQLWVDGQLVITSAVNAPQNYNGYWHIGHTPAGGFYSGLMDEVSITESDLNSTRITNRYISASV